MPASSLAPEAAATVALTGRASPSPDSPAPRAPSARPGHNWLADLVVVCVLGGLLAATLNVAHEWKQTFHPETHVTLSLRALPQYTLYSLARGWVAMACSMVFAITYATWAYYDRRARAILIPVLDILQSIPVLGFMPGLVLALVYLFPTSNFGLELSCVLMIFTAQVWNMVFSYYDSLKAIPVEMRDVGKICGYGPLERFWHIELPFAAQGLIYNGMVSMAGGWFFLTINEAFALGKENFQLPGLGSYMSVAIAQGDTRAQIAAVIAMGVMIIAVDRLVWWPLVIWSRKFKIEDTAAGPAETTLVQRVLERSRLFDVFTFAWRAVMRPRSRPAPPPQPTVNLAAKNHRFYRALYLGAMALVLGGGALGLYRLGVLLAQVNGVEWLAIILGALTTFARVLAALIVSSLWTIPVGVWIGLNPRVSRVLQPLVQFAASFPAPMLYPLVLGWILALGGNIGWGSAVLMMLGAQWYILFNVAAGAQSIPADMVACADIFQLRGWRRWLKFLLPAIFPQLVTGWLTAAGGAWNASIVAEYVLQKGQVYDAFGLGSLISKATNAGQFSVLAAAVVVMAVFVVAVNRLFWKRLQHWGDLNCRFGG